MITITFAQAKFLWFLLAIPVLVVAHFFLLRHARRKAMKFANFVALKRVTGERLITKNYTILLLRCMIIVCAVLAVSQATVWYESGVNRNEYVIAIDTSASMQAEDIPPSRLEAAKTYGIKFIEALDSNTRVGLISFSGVSFIEEPFTDDRSRLRDTLSVINITTAGTDIPGAIITGTNMLTATERGRAIILISDGSNTIEDFQSKSMQRAARYATTHYVHVFTIGVGRDQQTPLGYLPSYYNVSARYNADNLVQIANLTGGRFYEATDEESLQRAYDDIRGDTAPSRVPMHITPWLTLMTLALLVIEWILFNTRFRSLP